MWHSASVAAGLHFASAWHRSGAGLGREGREGAEGGRSGNGKSLFTQIEGGEGDPSRYGVGIDFVPMTALISGFGWAVNGLQALPEARSPLALSRFGLPSPPLHNIRVARWGRVGRRAMEGGGMRSDGRGWGRGGGEYWGTGMR